MISLHIRTVHKIMDSPLPHRKKQKKRTRKPQFTRARTKSTPNTRNQKAVDKKRKKKKKKKKTPA
jgi:hypothetical protein